MRVAIIGNSGSGKSTLAKRLAQRAGVPVLDLDTLAWEREAVTVRRDVAQAGGDVADYCAQREGWIVEGCYAGLIVATFARLPTLIFLDPGREACQANCRARPWEAHKYPSAVEQDRLLSFLLDWVADYYTRDGDMSLVAHRALFDGYAGPKQHLTALPDASFAATLHVG